MKNLLWQVSAWLAVACAVSALVYRAYTTGKYVGMTETHTEAIEAHCGYMDNDGWHWRKPVTIMLDPSYKIMDESGKVHDLL